MVILSCFGDLLRFNVFSSSKDNYPVFLTNSICLFNYFDENSIDLNFCVHY